MKAQEYVTQFDSASSMLYGLAYALRGKAYAGQEGISRLPPVVATIMNALPRWLQIRIYTGAGIWEAVPTPVLDQVRAEGISEWVTSQYPLPRRYPAMMIGSSNGAATHLCGLLGIPWLPQTVLVAARRRMPPDELKADLAWGREHVGGLLAANPDLQAHQMHDPLQDRLMVSRMGYFRLKRLRLGAVYSRFIEEHLEPGGTLILSECRFPWPAKQVGERHIFQVGGLGGIDGWEYVRGSDRVAEFLQRQRPPLTRWEVDEPDGEFPEAEWGFVPELGEDTKQFAAKHGYQLRRLVFHHPEDLSAFVADFHGWWYQQHGPAPRGLMAECFGLVEPWWAVRTRYQPFWLAFTAEPSAKSLERFLKARPPFDQIYLSLISNGANTIGLASMDRWRGLLNRARVRGEVIGIQEKKYPMDIGSFVSYDDELETLMQPQLQPPLPAAGLADVERFLAERSGQYPLEWVGGGGSVQRHGAVEGVQRGLQHGQQLEEQDYHQDRVGHPDQRERPLGGRGELGVLPDQGQGERAQDEEEQK